MSNRIQARPKTANPATRARLEKVLKNENHRALLIKKFKSKYGTNKKTSEIINKLVTDFIKSTPHITQENLSTLDSNIKNTLFSIKSPEKIFKENKQIMPIKTTAQLAEETFGPKRPGTASYIEKNKQESEEKGWSAIFKFNEELYKEEQKREKEKEKAQKEQTRIALLKQMEEKKKIIENEHKEISEYIKLREKHLQNQDQLEKEKQAKIQAKRDYEKKILEEALEKEKIKKEQLARSEYEKDKETLRKVSEDILEEGKLELARRKAKNEYMQRIMQENELNRKRREEMKSKEKLDDQHMLEEYAKMLEKQEQDRIDEVKKREKRTQQLMVRLADTVIKEMERKRLEDELKMLQKQQEKDKQDQLDDEMRLKRIKEHQRNIKKKLEEQMYEKKAKEMMEKEENKKQAEAWKKDLETTFKEEKEIAEKIRKVNLEYQEYLKTQMKDKNADKKDILTREEFLMNRDLLKKIEEHHQ